MIRRGFHLGQISSDRTFLPSDVCFRFTLAPDAYTLYSTLPLLLGCFTFCVSNSNKFIQCSSGPDLSPV